MAGWCTSGVDLEDSPEVEVMCGGINTKTPQHAGLWRQGNLLHFGFEEPPSQLNDVGQAILENAIVYIARFPDDRPILDSPSGFVDKRYPRSRTALRKALADVATTSDRLCVHFEPKLRARLQQMPLDQAREWIADRMDFLASGSSGLLELDVDAEALGIAMDEPSFFDAVLTRLDDPDLTARTRALLVRRVPEAPADDPADFVRANRDYLFFSETGGYVWRLDPLAKARGIPTRTLRGPLRATPREIR